MIKKIYLLTIPAYSKHIPAYSKHIPDYYQNIWTIQIPSDAITAAVNTFLPSYLTLIYEILIFISNIL